MLKTDPLKCKSAPDIIGGLADSPNPKIAVLFLFHKSEIKQSEVIN